MPKNNAFKSFISVLFLLVGLFAYEKSASAALFSSNTDTDQEILSNGNVSGLIFQNTSGATVSISQAKFFLKDAPGNVHIEVASASCSTGAISGYPWADSQDTAITSDTDYAEYTFNWATPIEIPHQYLTDQCTAFIIWSGTADFLGGDRYYMEGFSQVYESGGSLTYRNYLPYHKIFTGAASPSIQITNPPADLVISFYDFNYTFTATKDAGDTATVLLQHFWYDGATLSEEPQQAAQFNYGIGTTIATGNVNTWTPGNGTFEVRATIFDTTTGISAIATRTVIINIAGNDPNEIIITGTDEMASYCSENGYGADSWFCKWVGSFETKLKSVPPISYIVAFKTGFTGMNASNSVGYTVIPAFIDNFFTYLWYILFIGLCFKFMSKLFK